MKACSFAVIAVALAFVAGCAGDGVAVLPTSPTAPSTPGPAVPPPALPIRGEIALAAMEPSSGASLQVFDCDPDFPPDLLRVTPKHYTGPCAVGFHAVVNVELEEELLDGRVTVELLDGSGKRCAYADSYSTALPARTQKSVTFDWLMLTDNAPNAAPLFCALPATTVDAVVSVSRAGLPVLSHRVSHSYTFVKR